jgi:hypothetical protein
MKKNIALLFLIALAGCTSSGLKPRSVDQYYVATGIEKYFLTDIPQWANFSQSAGCFRSSNIRYFDLAALMKSYSLKYTDALQIQGSFNEEFLAIKRQNNNSQISIKDEESLFYKASEKVNSKIIFFDPPTFKQIHLIWLDEALVGKKEEDRLRNFLTSSVHDNGMPILISSCLTKDEIEKRFSGLTTKIISAELFSVYDEKGEKKPSMHINVREFFKPEQKVIFYTQGTRKDIDDIGGVKTSNY